MPLKREAIHPGFGFLSENSKFVEMCEKCNITFIGPSAEVISRMGNKSAARDTMRRAGVSVVPGTKEPVYHAEEALEIAKKSDFSDDQSFLGRAARDAHLLVRN